MPAPSTRRGLTCWLCATFLACNRLLDPVKVAHSYFTHPDDSDWQDELVSIWAGEHPDNIKDASDAAIFEALHYEHAPCVDQSAWERLKKLFD